MLQESLGHEESISKSSGQGFYLSQKKSAWTSDSNLYLGRLGKWGGLGEYSALQGTQTCVCLTAAPCPLQPSHVTAGTGLGCSSLGDLLPSICFITLPAKGKTRKDFPLLKSSNPCASQCQPVPAQTRIPSLSGSGSPHSVIVSHLPITLNTAPVGLPTSP